MQRWRRSVLGRLRLRVAAKFVLAVGVLMLLVAAVAGIGAVGLARSDAEASRLFTDNLVTTERTADLTAALDDVQQSALQLIPTVDPGPTAELDAELDQVLVPLVRQLLDDVRALNRGDRLPQQKLDQIQAGLKAPSQQVLRPPRGPKVPAVGRTGPGSRTRV